MTLNNICPSFQGGVSFDRAKWITQKLNPAYVKVVADKGLAAGLYAWLKSENRETRIVYRHHPDDNAQNDYTPQQFYDMMRDNAPQSGIIWQLGNEPFVNKQLNNWSVALQTLIHAKEPDRESIIVTAPVGNPTRKEWLTNWDSVTLAAKLGNYVGVNEYWAKMPDDRKPYPPLDHPIYVDRWKELRRLFGPLCPPIFVGEIGYCRREGNTWYARDGWVGSIPASTFAWGVIDQVAGYAPNGIVSFVFIETNNPDWLDFVPTDAVYELWSANPVPFRGLPKKETPIEGVLRADADAVFNVRERPTTTAPIVGSMKNGDVAKYFATLVEDADRDADGRPLYRWYVIERGGKTQYVAAYNEITRQPVATFAPNDGTPAPIWENCIVKDVDGGLVVRIRQEATTSSAQIGALTVGQPIRADVTNLIKNSEGEWYRIESGGYVAHIHKGSYISEIVRASVVPTPVRLLDVPFVSQLGGDAKERSNDCFIACALMVYQHKLIGAGFGLNRVLTVDGVIAKSPLATNNNPVTLNQGLQFMSALGLTATLVRPLDLQKLTQLIDAGTPAIALVAYKHIKRGDAFAGGHYVVVVGYGVDGFWVHDPYNGGESWYVPNARMDLALTDLGAAAAYDYQGIVS